MKDKRIQQVTVVVLVALIVVPILAVMPDKKANHDSGNIATELKISEFIDGLDNCKELIKKMT